MVPPGATVVAAAKPSSLVAVIAGAKTGGSGAGCGTGAVSETLFGAALVPLAVSALCSFAFDARLSPGDSALEGGANGTRGIMIKSQVSKQALSILRPVREFRGAGCCMISLLFTKHEKR